MPDQVLRTAEATSAGDGRGGHVASSDGRIDLDLDLALPPELGGTGANPEQLLAAGYAACFHRALRQVAGREPAPVRPYSRATRGNISVEISVEPRVL
jgi:lipoyl-dependent peroxiredoxin